jgi:hypothetical protein
LFSPASLGAAFWMGFFFRRKPFFVAYFVFLCYHFFGGHFCLACFAETVLTVLQKAPVGEASARQATEVADLPRFLDSRTEVRIS